MTNLLPELFAVAIESDGMMIDLIAPAAAEADSDPAILADDTDQPRDERGRWAEAPGGGAAPGGDSGGAPGATGAGAHEASRKLAALRGKVAEHLRDVAWLGKAIKEGAAGAAQDAGKAYWDHLPEPAQKGLARVYGIGKGIAHALEIAHPLGQAMCRDIARQKGYSEKGVERVGKIVTWVDTACQWGVNWQVAEHVCAHLGVHGLGALGIAKGSGLVPVGSIAYIGASTLANPARTVRAARAAVHELRHAHQHQQHAHHPGGGPREHAAVAALLKRFDEIPAAQHDWYEALLYVCLDETRGELDGARVLADAALAARPEPDYEAGDALWEDLHDA